MEKKRKEVHLDDEVVRNLEAQAKRFNRSLKNHLETVLIHKSKEKPASFR